MNAIDPGAVRTSMAEQFEVSAETTEWLNKQQTVDEKRRFRPPSDVVPILIFLASEESRAMNGRFPAGKLGR